MNELQVNVNQVPGTIEFNYEEIKDNLSRMMELYKDATFTEESKTIAKKEVASLRKIKKAIDDARKEVKEKCLEPYREFEAKAMALMSLVDEPILLIDKQVKEFDEKQKAEKHQKIRAAYDALAGDMETYLPFDRAFDPRWENVSVSMKKVTDELSELLSSTRTAVETIMAMQSEASEKALEMYKNTLDMAASIQYINRYEQQKAEILMKEQQRQKEEEERKRQAEIDRIRAEERRRMAEEDRIREEERKKAVEEQEKSAVKEAAGGFFTAPEDPVQGFDMEEETSGFQTEEKMTAFYKVTATESELEEVEMAFNSIGILFERRDA